MVEGYKYLCAVCYTRYCTSWSFFPESTDSNMNRFLLICHPFLAAPVPACLPSRITGPRSMIRRCHDFANAGFPNQYPNEGAMTWA